jgi:C4-dicarboxylate transporter DctM subunit
MEAAVTAEILLATLLVLFLIDTPIAVAIGAASVAAIVLTGDFPLQMVSQRLFSGADSFHLLAVPLFMFAGTIMEAGGISRRLIEFATALVGWLPGGMAAVAVVSAMFFAGISGSAAADTAAVGSIMIPAMKKGGYRSEFAAAVQASGGSIGIIIPPSIPMIIFGFLTGVSVGRLFTAGILPGIIIGLSLIVVSSLVSRQQGYGAQRSFSAAEVLRTGKRAMLALGAPAIILGGILSGIFTATESAGAAVVYGLVVGMLVYRQIGLKDLPRLFVEGSITAAIVMFIIACASVFSWLAAIEDIPARLAGGLLALSDNRIVLLLLVNLVLLVAGTFVETTAALILLVPMLVAMLPAIGVDAIQLGVIVVVNLAIGMLTPPMGICLIVSASISGDRLALVCRQVAPFLLILLIDLAVITYWPPLTLTLVGLLH